jgi:radical SAM superfamily enzyme YgiQ (UPF0313 family)
MRTRVTLVNPPYPVGSHQHPPFTPLGLGYLAAVLEKEEYPVDVIDCQVLRCSHEEFRSMLSELKQPDIVGITSTTLTYNSALKIAKIAKEGTGGIPALRYSCQEGRGKHDAGAC